jgi:hypothetical protein
MPMMHHHRGHACTSSLAVLGAACIMHCGVVLCSSRPLPALVVPQTGHAEARLYIANLVPVNWLARLVCVQGNMASYRPPPDFPSLMAALTSPDWLQVSGFWLQHLLLQAALLT